MPGETIGDIGAFTNNPSSAELLGLATASFFFLSFHFVFVCLFFLSLFIPFSLLFLFISSLLFSLLLLLLLLLSVASLLLLLHLQFLLSCSTSPLKLHEQEERPDAHLNLGLLYQRMNDYQKAESAYRQALKLQPEFVPAWINLARFYSDLNREKDALQILELKAY